MAAAAAAAEAAAAAVAVVVLDDVELPRVLELEATVGWCCGALEVSVLVEVALFDVEIARVPRNSGPRLDVDDEDDDSAVVAGGKSNATVRRRFASFLSLGASTEAETARLRDVRASRTSNTLTQVGMSATDA